jgi:hypothetical protein
LGQIAGRPVDDRQAGATQLFASPIAVLLRQREGLVVYLARRGKIGERIRM